MRRSLLLAATVLTALTPGIGSASETIAYSYDARGRLVAVNRSGTVNNGVAATYTYDRADNRTNLTVTGSSGSSPPATPPSFVISDPSVTEGGSLVFTVTKNGSASGSVGVTFATADGSATAPGDYASTSGTLTFAPSETSRTVSVATVDDSSVESAETITVNLSSPIGGAAIADAQGTGTINDNDAAATPPSFAVSDVAADEAAGTITFTVTKTGSTSSSFSLSYATANNTAVAGSDYTSASATLTFAANETSKAVSVSLIDDSIIENAETFYLNLSAASGGATITDAQGVATINDNDDTGGGDDPPDWCPAWGCP